MTKFPRPSPSIFAYCKRSKTGLGMRLCTMCNKNCTIGTNQYPWPKRGPAATPLQRLHTESYCHMEVNVTSYPWLMCNHSVGFRQDPNTHALCSGFTRQPFRLENPTLPLQEEYTKKRLPLQYLGNSHTETITKHSFGINTSRDLLDRLSCPVFLACFNIDSEIWLPWSVCCRADCINAGFDLRWRGCLFIWPDGSPFANTWNSQNGNGKGNGTETHLATPTANDVSRKRTQEYECWEGYDMNTRSHNLELVSVWKRGTWAGRGDLSTRGPDLVYSILYSVYSRAWSTHSKCEPKRAWHAHTKFCDCDCEA